MTTGCRECCGIIATTIGPTAAEFRPLPRTNAEMRKFLKAAITQSDAEDWHRAQLSRVAGISGLKGTGFKKVCTDIGFWLLKGCKRIQDLRIWVDKGLLPDGIYNERHLLNTALGHLKSAFEAMEIIAKTPRYKECDSPARPIALQYFVQIYLLLLVLWKVAYGKEFDDYFQGPEWYEVLQDPDNVVEFEPLEQTYDDDLDIQNICLANVLPPVDQVPIRHFHCREARPTHIPKIFSSDLPYGRASVPNALLLDAGSIVSKNDESPKDDENFKSDIESSKGKAKRKRVEA